MKIEPGRYEVTGSPVVQTALRVDATVIRAPVIVVPTPYPNNPSEPLVRGDYLRLDIHSAEFRKLNTNLDALLVELVRSNQIAGELRDQLTAELQAGRAMLKAPKPDSNLLKALLLHPLTFLATAAAGGIIGEYANEALHALLRIFESNGIPL